MYNNVKTTVMHENSVSSSPCPVLKSGWIYDAGIKERSYSNY